MKKPRLLLASYYLGLLVFIGFIALIFFNFKSGMNDIVTIVILSLGCLSWLIMFAVGNVMNGISLAMQARQGAIREMAGAVRLLKFGSIPFFILNFALSGTFFAALTAATRGIGIILLPIPFLVTWVIMMSSSVNSITLLVILRRRKAVSGTFFAINLICQLAFVADILSAFFILRKAKKAIDPGA